MRVFFCDFDSLPEHDQAAIVNLCNEIHRLYFDWCICLFYFSSSSLFSSKLFVCSMIIKRNLTVTVCGVVRFVNKTVKRLMFNWRFLIIATYIVSCMRELSWSYSSILFICCCFRCCCCYFCCYYRSLTISRRTFDRHSLEYMCMARMNVFTMYFSQNTDIYRAFVCVICIETWLKNVINFLTWVFCALIHL